MWKATLLTLLVLFSQYHSTISQSEDLKLSYKHALEAIFGIGVRLQVFLEEPNQVGKNFLVSPLSTALMLGQLMIGAEGKFRQQLYSLLSLPETEYDQLHSVIGYYYKHNDTHVNFHIPYAALHLELANLLRDIERSGFSKSFNLTTANALFINSDLKVKDEFRHNLGLYKTFIRQLNFSQDPVGCQKVINDWAAEQTNNLIKIILSSPPLASDGGVFTNAVYFKADWETPFSYELTYQSEFNTNINETTDVEYMRGFVEDIPYGESKELGCKMIGLPYKGEAVTMYIFLPNENNGTEYNIKEFASKLQFTDVMNFINKSKIHNVNVQLPKMKLSNRISILEAIQKFTVFKKETGERAYMGDPERILKTKIEEYKAFNTTEKPDLYLTNAVENENLRISNILQEIVLTVDEKGTEAAAVSASLVDYSGGNKNFKIDRPFLFFIRHEPTSAVLFWGSIANPAQED